jgi:hypothetical protein
LYSIVFLAVRDDGQPDALAVVPQAAVLAIGTTWGATRAVHRARRAAGEVAVDEDVVAVMAFVDRRRGDLAPAQQPMAERFARRELAGVDRRAVLAKTAVITVLVALVAALLGGPIAAFVVGGLTAVVTYGVIEALSTTRRSRLEAVLSTLGDSRA